MVVIICKMDKTGVIKYIPTKVRKPRNYMIHEEDSVVGSLSQASLKMMYGAHSRTGQHVRHPCRRPNQASSIYLFILAMFSEGKYI